MSRAKEKLCAQFAELLEELIQWRAEHPEASLDEIAAHLTPRRRELMGTLLAELAVQPGNGHALEGLICEECGQSLVYKGTPHRIISHSEGEIPLKRAYYHCPRCERGLFPPGCPTGAGRASLDSADPPTSLERGRGYILSEEGRGSL